MRRLIQKLEAPTGWVCWRLGIIRRLQRRQVGRILVYHNVTDDPDALGSLPLHVFARHMELLAEQYRVVSLDALVDMIEGQSAWIKRAVAITFDDGYEDNYACAFPILNRYGFPATIYLPTDYIDTGQPIWINALIRAFHDTAMEHLGLPGPLGEHGTLTLLSAEDRIRAASKAVGLLYQLPPHTRSPLVSQMIEESGVDLGRGQARPSDVRFLDWGQVREMSSSGLISFGSHGQSHSRFSLLPDDVLRRELSASREIIEEKTGGPVRHAAYPNGHPGDYDERAVRLLDQLNFRSCVTLVDGNIPTGANRYELPRITCYDPRPGSCLARLEGVKAAFARVSGLSLHQQQAKRPPRRAPRVDPDAATGPSSHRQR